MLRIYRRSAAGASGLDRPGSAGAGASTPRTATMENGALTAPG
jgi:hypothetical protein